MNLSHKWAVCAGVALLAGTPWVVAQAQPMQQDQPEMQNDRGDRDVQSWNDQSGQMQDRDQMRQRDQMRMPQGRHDRAAALQYSPDLRRASELLGKEVVDVKGEKAGTVDDLVIDADAGMIGYVIVARGGVLGMGERLVPVPFKSFRRTSGGGLMLETEKAVLDHARSLKGDNISLLSNPGEAEDIHSQFNVQPYWASLRRMGPGEGMRSARRMQQQEFESGRDQGVYGYGQPGEEKEKILPDRRDRSAYMDNTRSNDYEQSATGDQGYTEQPYATSRHERKTREDGAKRTDKDKEKHRTKRHREEGRSTENIEPQGELDTYEMDEGETSQRWERERRGEPVESGTVTGKPIERPQWRSASGLNRPGTLILAKDLMEEDVEGPRQQTVGELEDLMVDMHTGGIAYAVVSEPGLEKNTYHAVPWTLFGTREGRHHEVLTLDMTRRDLQDSPSFQKRDWPDMASSRWTRYVHNYFGVEPAWEYYGYVEPGAEGTSLRFDPQSMTTIRGTVEGINRRGQLGGETNIVRLRITTTGAQQPTAAAPGAATQPAQAGAATRPAQAATEMMRPGEPVTVYLGPTDYIRQQDFALRGGDTVTIEGSRVTIDGEPAILASRVIGGEGKTLELRNAQGEPMWSRGQRGTLQDRLSEPRTGEQGGMQQEEQVPAEQGQPGQ